MRLKKKKTNKKEDEGGFKPIKENNPGTSCPSNESTGRSKPFLKLGNIKDRFLKNSRTTSLLTGDLAGEDYHPPNTSVQRRTQERTPVRRHTVQSGDEILQAVQEHERKTQNNHLDQPEDLYKKERNLFLDHLASKFPEHANKIKGPAGQKAFNQNQEAKTRQYQRKQQHPPMLRPASVEPQRRIGAQYSNTGRQSSGFDDDGMMSENETEATGAFRRGGMARSSLPVVRDPSRAYDRQTGMLFLIFRGETKRAWLPNQVRHIDDIKMLFVRLFPATLSMKLLDGNKKKLYILNPSNNMYHPLVDLNSIRDRTVLKLIEPDGEDHGPGRRNSSEIDYMSEPEEAMRVRRPPPKSVSYQGFSNTLGRDNRLPQNQDYLTYEQIQQMYNEQRKTLQRESMQPRPASALPFSQPPPSVRISSRSTTPQPQSAYSPTRGPPGYSSVPASPSMSRDLRLTNGDFQQYDRGSRSNCVTPTPESEDLYNKKRMAKMEAQIANLTAWMGSEHGSRPSSRAASVASSHSPRSSISEGSTSTPQPMVSIEMQTTIRMLHNKAKELKTECRNLRRIQQAQSENIRETITDAFQQIQTAIAVTPGALDAPTRARRTRVNEHIDVFKGDGKKIGGQLSDLEASVEELRSDVINRRCRVNMSDVETMALGLSHISKALAELKGGFPPLQEEMKMVMEGEMEIVVKEERFLREEPEAIDDLLRKCKKLTGTLFTLKRLASVQEHRSPQVPNLDTKDGVDDDEKNSLLNNIKSIVPNHEARLNSIEAADASRERKKKLTVNAEAKKFEKSLELASKALRERRAVEADIIAKKEQEDRREKQMSKEDSTTNVEDDIAYMDEDEGNKENTYDTDTMKRRKNKTSTLPQIDVNKNFSETSQENIQIESGSAPFTKATSTPIAVAPESTCSDPDVSNITTLDHGVPYDLSQPKSSSSQLTYDDNKPKCQPVVLETEFPVYTNNHNMKKETTFSAVPQEQERPSAFQRLQASRPASLNPVRSNYVQIAIPGSTERRHIGKPSIVYGNSTEEIKVTDKSSAMPNKNVHIEDPQMIPTKDITPERDLQPGHFQQDIVQGVYSNTNRADIHLQKMDHHAMIEGNNNHHKEHSNKQPPTPPKRQSSSRVAAQQITELRNDSRVTGLQEQSRRLQELQRQHSLKRPPKEPSPEKDNRQHVSYSNVLVSRPRPTRAVIETCVDDNDDLL